MNAAQPVHSTPTVTSDANALARARAPAQPVLAIIGATGAVGLELIHTLERRNFPLGGLRLFASARSAGRTFPFRGARLLIRELTEDSFAGVDMALFSAGSNISRRFAPRAVESGAIVIDNSSAFRMEPGVPLVVPEINGDAMHNHRGILANPNCAAIISLLPLWPIHRVNPIRRLIIATYQAASGGGAAAMQELLDATRAHLDGYAHAPKVLPHPYAFNLFSHNTPINPTTGYNEEETKVIQETRKILGDANIRVSATCIRVPVLRAHSIAINVECSRPVTPTHVRELLASARGVTLVDDPARNHFPMPTDATGKDPILVGRIRQDLSDPTGHSIAMFVTGDQLLKGAALNAVQIAEQLIGP